MLAFRTESSCFSSSFYIFSSCSPSSWLPLDAVAFRLILYSVSFSGLSSRRLNARGAPRSRFETRGGSLIIRLIGLDRPLPGLRKVYHTFVRNFNETNNSTRTTLVHVHQYCFVSMGETELCARDLCSLRFVSWKKCQSRASPELFFLFNAWQLSSRVLMPRAESIDICGAVCIKADEEKARENGVWKFESPEER